MVYALKEVFNQWLRISASFPYDISINYCSISSSLAIEFICDVYDLMLSYITCEFVLHP